VQSSIAFTSIARGNVSAALVSASLSNIVGVVLTPLLVVLLMETSGAARMDATAIRDIVLQLLPPFAMGQLLRPWIAGWIARHTILTKVVDRGSILLIVYTAFSIGMVERPGPPAAHSNTAARSATRSNAEPDPKARSTTSNEATAGTAPNSPASTGPEPGADTAS
jgi:SBF-like CPA transporter family (DUF4137)